MSKYPKAFDVSAMEAEINSPELRPGGITYVTEPERHPLLTTRQSTHGDFAENALVSQMLKRCFRASTGWDRLTDVEREAMDMIALKFSRILSGKSMERQHWEDVVGYGKLVEDLCK
jgi:hypothetical protein